MKFDKNMLLLYAVTDRTWTLTQSLYEQLESALLGGVTIVQLREKNLSEDEFIAEAIQIKELCHRYNVPLLINDNVEVALKSGADGVHVGLKDTPVNEIRKKVGNDFIIGATAKTVEQAIAAQNAGADYLGVGAVFPSKAKPEAIRITPGQLKEICLSVSIPVVAIGGITSDNINELNGGKLAGVAIVSAIFGAKDIRLATKELKLKIHSLITKNPNTN